MDHGRYAALNARLEELEAERVAIEERLAVDAPKKKKAGKSVDPSPKQD